MHERGAPHLDRPRAPRRERAAPLRRRLRPPLGRGRAGARGQRPRARGSRPGPLTGDVPAGFRVAYTPGPRVAPRRRTSTRRTARAYAGDVAGVRIDGRPGPARRRRRPTSTWRPGTRRSTCSRGWDPQRLCVTHFGTFDGRGRAARRGRARASTRWRPRPVASTPPPSRPECAGGSPPTRRRRSAEEYFQAMPPETAVRRPGPLLAQAGGGAGALACARCRRPSSSRASGGPDDRAGRRLARDRAQRRPQHVRPRGAHAGARASPASRWTPGYAIADRSTTPARRIVWSGPPRAGRALLGPAARRGARRWPRSSRGRPRRPPRSARRSAPAPRRRCSGRRGSRTATGG